MKKFLLLLTSLIFIAISIGFLTTINTFRKFLDNQNIDNSALTAFLDSSSRDTTQEPKLNISKVIEGLSNPWDISFVNKNLFFFTQRFGELRSYNLTTKENTFILKPEDVYVRGEGGLLGLKVDVDYANNHYLYTCMNVNGPSISLVRWKLDIDNKSILERKDIITGIPSNISGRHSGCRISMDKNGILFIGTGDTANGTVPQDPLSLGGKILRVDREGKGIEGNLASPFDNRIFNYGHRNVQGIVLFDNPVNGLLGLNAEHGPDKNDEINLVVKGNFGWNPIPGYNESVSMTDLTQYPDAIPSIWSSGEKTIAISGMTILRGNIWKAWEGAVLTSVLKDMHVRLQTYDSNWKLTRDDKILEGYGRIRTVTQSPSGDLYFSSDNGGGKDVIMVVSPE